MTIFHRQIVLFVLLLLVFVAGSAGLMGSIVSWRS